MKIACFGDSWTDGWGIQENEKWCTLIEKAIPNCTVQNFGVSGVSNETIHHIATTEQEIFDVYIFCWTSIVRQETPEGMMDFSYVEDHLLQNRINFYKQYSLQDLFNIWEEKILDVNKKFYKSKVLHFSVFGDTPVQTIDNFYNPSMLELLSSLQGNNFQYNIPTFEFDWLYDNNLPLTEPFAKKYFDSEWKKAIIEREDIRPGKYFLDCGHPNKLGHRAWAEYVKQYI